MNIKKIIIPLVVFGIAGGSAFYVYSLNKPQKEVSAKPAAAEDTPDRLMIRAGWMALEGRRPEANQLYERVLKESPDSFYSKIAEARLLETGFDRYFQSLNRNNAEIYTVKSGDVVDKIAKQYNVTTGLVSLSNGLKDDRIYPGQELKIMKDRWHIIADKSTNLLILKAGDTVVKTYPIGTGKEGSTPVGEFKIVNRLKNPTWYYQGTVAQSGASDNPLGTRWMGFDIEGYGLHGTTDRNSIGKYETLGCVRMLNEDVEELFEILPVGTTVSIIESAIAAHNAESLMM